MEKKKDEPFFLWVSYNAPHSPFQCKQEHYDALSEIEDPIKRVYNAMLLSLDENIGQLLEAVNQLGLEENTMIVFLSDNGGAEYTFATDNGSYKGGKITDLEGGLKVPMFVKWKNHISPNTEFSKPVISLDLFSTIMAATKTTLPTNRAMDGVDLLPFIQGEKTEPPHEFIYWQRGSSRAIRSMQYKVVLNDMLQDTVLFDLQIDPFESQNIYNAHKEEATRLVRELNKWTATLPEPLWPAVIYYEYLDGEQRYLFDQ